MHVHTRHFAHHCAVHAAFPILTQSQSFRRWKIDFWDSIGSALLLVTLWVLNPRRHHSRGRLVVLVACAVEVTAALFMIFCFRNSGVEAGAFRGTRTRRAFVRVMRNSLLGTRLTQASARVCRRVVQATCRHWEVSQRLHTTQCFPADTRRGVCALCAGIGCRALAELIKSPWLHDAVSEA